MSEPSNPTPGEGAAERHAKRQQRHAASAKALKTTWKRRRGRSKSSLFAAGEPMVWLTGGSLVICGVMVVGLLSLVLWKGGETFWPSPVTLIETSDGRPYLGEITRFDSYRPEESVLRNLPQTQMAEARQQMEAADGWLDRRLMRTGNYRLTQSHFRWIDQYEIADEAKPPWALVVERLEWGRFYGFPEAFLELFPIEDKTVAVVVEEARRQGHDDIRILDEQVIDGVQQPVLMPVAEAERAVRPRAVVKVFDGPELAWQQLQEHHHKIRQRWQERRELEKFDTGEVNHRLEAARLEVRDVELRIERRKSEGQAVDHLQADLEAAQVRGAEVESWAAQEFQRIRSEIDQINRSNRRYQMLMRTAGEGGLAPRRTLLGLDDIVRTYPANRLDLGAKVSIYLSRWWEFLSDEPREANSEGGVYPAIFGTVAMTLIMSLAVVPFGVLAALYLREYAKAGPLVSAVRIAVNNLAGVPSIVFGVFGLGFFCYVMGASIDEVFFAAQLPNPTFGKGGLMWASFTLALLTLPVVIVATEEAVAAVPSSMREGSYACGASKWQTIQRIVLPRALPGIITGMILAIARGAGEVAPLMLVGAVKLAPELPVDGLFPFVHPQRSFMHLGFHIYDVGFQSPNAEAAKPMVFTTTLLLIALIATLNFAAVWLRNRLRRRFAGGQF